MNKSWIVALSVMLLPACNQQQVHTGETSPLVTPSVYIRDLLKFDDPDFLVQRSDMRLIPPAKFSGISARFTNADQGRLLGSETNYFNGEIDSIGVYEYTTDQLTRVVWYNSAGPDGIWQTTDDTISGYHDHAPTAPDVLYVIYRGSGTDQIWFSDDDDILYYLKPVSDGAGNTIGIATFTLPGDDNIWFTDDDFIGWLTAENTSVNEIRWILYLGAGADNDWLTTEDNDILRFSITTLNSQGQRQRHSYFEATGLDGLPFTEDDPPVYYHDFGYDDQGRISQNIMYGGGPGDDGIWYTADDMVSSCKIQNRDTNDLPIQTISYRPGPDQSCFTNDDVIWGYHDDTFDQSNLLTESFSYYQPGTDGTWFTTDDVLIYSRQYR